MDEICFEVESGKLCRRFSGWFCFMSGVIPDNSGISVYNISVNVRGGGLSCYTDFGKLTLNCCSISLEHR